VRNKGKILYLKNEHETILLSFSQKCGEKL